MAARSSAQRVPAGTPSRAELLAELSRSRSQLEESQAIARIGSWEIHTDPRTVTWSPQLFTLLDVDPETFRPGAEAFIERVVEADRGLVQQTWDSLGEEQAERDVDCRVRLGDGTERWVRVRGRTLERAPDGTAIRFGGTVQDIDDLKRAELELLDAVEVNTLMHFIATAANETNTLDEALVRTRELLLAHPDWARGVAFDVTADGLVFRRVSAADTVVPSALERLVAERVLLEDGTVFEEELDVQHPLIGFPVLRDGQPVVVLVVTAESPFERHEMMRSLVGQVSTQLAQVAGREATATELSAARDLAMAASESKSDFLATMSHEIRTPLNGVIGLNDLLLRTELDDHQRQLAEAMQGASRTLLVLISDILDFSKIEAGGLELEAVEFRPAVVVNATSELFGPMAATKGIDLDVEIEPGVPEWLEGDPSRFGQVLSNLVANAVKFTQEGGVHIRVSSTVSDGAVTLRVAVRDTGIGMDAEQRGRIFQPFRQADASTTRTFGGTGLGLAIAQRLASALGGRIGVASEPGEGSTFWFTSAFRLPSVVRESAVRAPTRTAEDRPGGHVLVVEDNEVNQLVAVGMLQVLGYTCEVVGDGAAAAARAAGGGFDAVLMDLQMPRLDGYAATRLIRQAEGSGPRVPIIALTASVTTGESERCLAAGMTGFLPKPIDVDSLGRALAEQLGGEVAVPTAVVEVVEEVEVGSVGAAVTLDVRRLEELAEMGADALPLVQRAIDNFVASMEPTVDELRTALAASDAGGLRSVAHRLKGSAANLGAARVAELALELELLAEDSLLGPAAQALEELAVAGEAACAALTGYRLDGVAISA
jgi:signal transduction histidine kinase/HPt (histidine-containing phosphotransfer) domain-containing protein/ActR/RegA family two-component response regulator